MSWWSRANCPGASVFQNTRAHARMKLSWNCFWWNDRCHPCPSSASSAFLHSAIRSNPLDRRTVLARFAACSADTNPTATVPARTHASYSSYSAW